ncbi:MAG: hypothetical protein IT381_27955 [Deltaproteobacteria bacterium]|nr:hypothetical protein [Deltaproteobacteria bacterium]
MSWRFAICLMLLPGCLVVGATKFGARACDEGFVDNGEGGCDDVDECAANPCDPLRKCENDAGSFHCAACPGGFVDAGDFDCVDIDECASGQSGCDAIAGCVNIAGAFVCGACPPGYAGTGTTSCVDIDECAAAACDPRAGCFNSTGGYSCGVCPAGFSGTGATTCVNVDECATNHGGCDDLASCTDSEGAYACGPCPVDFYQADASTCEWLLPELSALAAPAGFLTPAFAGATTSYDLFLSWRQATGPVDLSPSVAYPTHAILRIEGSAHASGAPYALGPVALGGTLALALSVESNGGQMKSYAVTARRLAAQASGYGARVAMSADGTAIIVGDTGGRTGKIYRYDGAGWVLEHTMNGGASPFGFGTSVAISADGKVAAVGAPGGPVSGQQGQVSVVRRVGVAWSGAAVIAGSEADTLFGTSLALSADGAVLAIGQPGGDHDQLVPFPPPPHFDSVWVGAGGRVLVYRFTSGWALEATLNATGAEDMDSMGTALAISAGGDVIVAGAPREDSDALNVGGAQNNNASEAGAAYVFRKTGSWAQEAYLKASNTGASDGFGSAVAISGDGQWIAASAPGEDSCRTGVDSPAPDDEGCNYTGAVYVFAKPAGVWQAPAYFKATPNAALGPSVALDGDGSALLVGGGVNTLWFTRAPGWAQAASIPGAGPVSTSASGSPFVKNGSIYR